MVVLVVGDLKGPAPQARYGRRRSAASRRPWGHKKHLVGLVLLAVELLLELVKLLDPPGLDGLHDLPFQIPPPPGLLGDCDRHGVSANVDPPVPCHLGGWATAVGSPPHRPGVGGPTAASAERRQSVLPFPVLELDLDQRTELAAVVVLVLGLTGGDEGVEHPSEGGRHGMEDPEQKVHERDEAARPLELGGAGDEGTRDDLPKHEKDRDAH